MDCKKAQEFLYLYADDEMGEELLVSFRAHLGCCPECERRSHYTRKLFEVLRRGCRRQAAPQKLRIRIRTLIAERRRES